MKFGETNLPSSSQVKKTYKSAPDKQSPGELRHTKPGTATLPVARSTPSMPSWPRSTVAPRKTVKKRKGK